MAPFDPVVRTCCKYAQEHYPEMGRVAGIGSSSEADHMNQTAVAFGDSIKITAAGFFHIRIFCERLEYLYGVLTVTPVSDSSIAQILAEFVRTEN